MELIYHRAFLSHDTGAHPENKGRLESSGELHESEIPYEESVLSLVHEKTHIEQVRSSCETSSPLDADTLTSPGSFRAAVLAANAAILASARNAFALVRPPGHHAYRDHSAGFCLFNNIAIAAQKAVNDGKRVAIIDIDGHYGDGTADIFYGSDQVLYCSLHQYPAYPGKGFVDETGEGAGKGFNVNVCLPTRSSDDIFMHALQEVIVPVVKQFSPDIVGVSAGFDASRYDPLLQLNVSTGCFHKAGRLIGKTFPNHFALLEGGYDLYALPQSIRNFSAGMSGEKIVHEDEATISPENTRQMYHSLLKRLRKNLSEIWKVEVN